MPQGIPLMDVDNHFFGAVEPLFWITVPLNVGPYTEKRSASRTRQVRVRCGRLGAAHIHSMEHDEPEYPCPPSGRAA